MPKKSATARNAAQRQKPKVQKSIELVRPEVSGHDDEVAHEEIASSAKNAPTATATPVLEKPVANPLPTAAVLAKPSEKVEPAAPKGSAAARMASRRIATQRAQQRNAAALITTEHFAYDRRDLIIIASLAVTMFAAIIVLYLFLGRGA
jgi:hypothetical protein